MNGRCVWARVLVLVAVVVELTEGSEGRDRRITKDRKDEMNAQEVNVF